MCLEVLKYRHKGWAPLVAEKDIEVAKNLVHRTIPSIRYDEGYYTPYQMYPVNFNKKGVAVLKTEHMNLYFHTYGDEAFVKQGIHAYRRVTRDLSCLNLYRAVIPKGTKYYLGYGNDIVAEKMIIYQDKNYDKKLNSWGRKEQHA